MKQEIIFIPLGGGQRVGASCYYLRIGESNVILDAGIGIESGMEFEPDFYSLVTSPFVQSMSQISQIFISHAHMDHIGYLLKLMSQTKHASVYMTEITKVLSAYQLYDRAFIGNRASDEDTRLAAQRLLENIAPVSYLQTLNFGKYKVTFYPAGHIPGAVMMLFEIGRRRILYTGDYSLNGTMLTQGCFLPEGLDIDTVILCGLHAKHPWYSKKTDAMYQQVREVLHRVETGRQSVLCRISQLSKGIEFLKVLNEWNTSQVPVYLDGSVMSMIEKMEKLSVPVLKPGNRIKGSFVPREPHVYITAEGGGGRGSYHCVRVDFSLHEDFGEMREFIKKVNPRQAVVVHCGKEKSVLDDTIEQEMMLDGECRTQFIFAEEKEIYRL